MFYPRIRYNTTHRKISTPKAGWYKIAFLATGEYPWLFEVCKLNPDSSEKIIIFDNLLSILEEKSSLRSILLYVKRTLAFFFILFHVNPDALKSRES